MNRIHAVRAAVTAITMLLVGAGTLRAQHALDTTFAVRSGARLSVWNQSGNIVVRSWTRNQIRVQAEYDRSHVEISETATSISVRSTRGGYSEVDYTITVPRGTAIETNGLAADVGITDVCGEIRINTVSGDVTVDCAEGTAEIQSVSGDVIVSNVRGRLEAGSTSGDVRIRGVRGGVSARSVSGDISLSQIEGDEASAETVSGDIDYAGRIADNGRYRFEAHSGDVTLLVSGSFNASVSVSTFSGDFTSDYQIQIQPGRPMGKDWEFRQGSGSARVQLKSFSGTINLRRAGSGAPREE
jgi:DUF4097 and DUF4098 domain-containing protein YvlB